MGDGVCGDIVSRIGAVPAGQASCRAAFLPYGAAGRVRAAYDSLAEAGAGIPYVAGAIRHFLDHQPPRLGFEPRSFFVVAYPGEGARLALSLGGHRYELPIPPPFEDPAVREERDRAVDAALAGYRRAHTRGVSQKLLAALSGLGRYGRNNLCYVEGLGSRFGLSAWYTNVPCDGIAEEAQPFRFMPECDGCAACIAACPTGAIREGRSAIDADRCLSRYNEVEGEIPDWIPPAAHEAITGCARCQDACPVNLALPRLEPRALELDGAESRELLDRASEGLSGGLRERLARFGMDGHILAVAGRNARLAIRNLG